MKRQLFTLLALCLFSFTSYGTIHTITVSDFAFAPASLTTVNTGDTVMWTWVSGEHTTTSGTIPAGAASWDNLITSSSTSFMYVPTVPGTYNYVCTPHAGMGMVGSFVASTPTGIGTIGTGILAAYPNPAASTLHVQLEKNDPATVKILNSTGRKVYQADFKGNTTIDVTHLANGMYFIEAVMQDKKYYGKVQLMH